MVNYGYCICEVIKLCRGTQNAKPNTVMDLPCASDCGAELVDKLENKKKRSKADKSTWRNETHKDVFLINVLTRWKRHISHQC